MRTEENLTVEAARVVLQRFPASCVVDTRPRCDGPTVVDLPKKRTHVVGHDATQMLGADLDPFGLQDLTYIEKRFEIFRLRVFAQHVFADQLVAAGMSLVSHHYRRFNVVVSG